MKPREQVLVTLISDPWRLSSAEGQVVRDLSTERESFRLITRTLLQDPALDTVKPLMFVIEPQCWEHFRSFRGMAGVRLLEISPLSQLRENTRVEPPSWLSNEIVSQWKLLQRTQPAAIDSRTWEAALAAWLLPGIEAVSCIEDWFRVLAFSSEFPEPFACEPVKAWISARFAAVAAKHISSRDVLDELLSALNGARSPVAFALEWATRVALLPTLDVQIENPLRTGASPSCSARERVLAKYLPLIFPLPPPAHDHVSGVMRSAVHKARLRDSSSLETTVLHLNALWDGIAEELMVWLDINPRSMTLRTVGHLSTIPGIDHHDLLRRAISEHSPPSAVPDWNGIDEHFDTWAVLYSQWCRQIFIRRELPEPAKDPAEGFGRWLKQNLEVCFVHPERSYLKVSATVREALKAGRPVIVALIDALAGHLTTDFADHVSDALGAVPSETRYLFAPIPTLSEVCKAAVLTGCWPSQSVADLTAALYSAYSLEVGAVVVASSWSDAARVHLTEQTRLVVYRDNRVDDQLASLTSYRTLLDECAGLFPRVAKLLTRWVGDLRTMSRNSPLLLVTADHGFTYGPPPGHDTDSDRKLDGHHRCIPIMEAPSPKELADASMTFLDPTRCHLKNGYLAARGRSFGRNAMSGWRMTHGGLLPEEVIIPLIQWFGQEGAVSWPTVSFPLPAKRDRGRWLLRVLIVNESAGVLPETDLQFRVVGHDQYVKHPMPRLGPGVRSEFELTLDGPDENDGGELAVDVHMRAHYPSGVLEDERCNKIPRERQLSERTNEQDDFENMF